MKVIRPVKIGDLASFDFDTRLGEVREEETEEDLSITNVDRSIRPYPPLCIQYYAVYYTTSNSFLFLIFQFLCSR